MLYLSNAFSLQMLGDAHLVTLDITQVEPGTWNNAARALSEGAALVPTLSIVGHEDTARVLNVPYNRQSVTLKPGDTLLVAQLTGGRLPEGATSLPDGFALKFYRVVIN